MKTFHYVRWNWRAGGDLLYKATGSIRAASYGVVRGGGNNDLAVTFYDESYSPIYTIAHVIEVEYIPETEE